MMLFIVLFQRQTPYTFGKGDVLALRLHAERCDNNSGLSPSRGLHSWCTALSLTCGPSLSLTDPWMANGKLLAPAASCTRLVVVSARHSPPARSAQKCQQRNAFSGSSREASRRLQEKASRREDVTPERQVEERGLLSTLHLAQGVDDLERGR